MDFLATTAAGWYTFSILPRRSAGDRRKVMKDAKTLAYINLFAVLGAIPYLCDLDRRPRS